VEEQTTSAEQVLTESNMTDAGKRVMDALGDLAAQDLSIALQVATGAFVSLLIAVMELHGHDTDREIRVDGGENRDITVHAPKHLLSERGKPDTPPAQSAE
jgi:hypothetical protein